MIADKLDWSKIDNFGHNEWPEGALLSMNSNVILALAKIRAMLPSGAAMNPSPLFAGHVRFDSHGRHSADDRLSDATDVFIDWQYLWPALLAAQQVNEIGGIGIYLDTHYDSKELHPMIHLDCRPGRMMWIRFEDVYTYYHYEPIKFFRLLAEHGKV